MRRFLLLLILILPGLSGAAQDNMDSLKRALTRATHDTTRLRILDRMVETEVDDNIWPRYNISMKLKAEYNLKRYPKHHPLYKVFKRYLGLALNNIGYLHSLKGDIYHALDYYYRALAIQREVGDRKGEATTYNNLGSVIDDQGDHEKAVEYYRKSYAIQQQVGDTAGMSISLTNIGFYFDNIGRQQEALDHYLRSLQLSQELDDPQGQVYTMNNISLTYLGFKRYDKALQYAQWALKLSRETDYLEAVAFSYNCLGNVYMEMGDLARARTYGMKSYDIAGQLGFPATIGNAAQLLSEVHEKMGQHALALKYYKQHIRMRDSITNESNKKLSIKRQFQADYEKKAAADSVRALEEKKVIDARLAERDQRIEKEKIQNIALVGGMVLVLVFAGFIFNRFRITKKQSRIIQQKEKEAQHQKDLVVSKQKEIIDSINYAQRIQSAILPSEEEIRNYFPESFLLYKPKDIIAGDFYFFEKTGTHVFYAAADCTGHGVPGALVSVVCANALARCVKEFGLTEPGKILDKTRELVIETFEKSGQEVKDGMDISLISLKRDRLEVESSKSAGESNTQTFKQPNVKLQWAGANNPLWVINGHNGLTEMKADKQPIGLIENPRPFTTHTLRLEKGSQVILFTDGYADQFGGERGKKFKYKNLAKLLVQQFTRPMSEQVQVLDHTFENWRGTLEQVDDVCVIGIKL